MTQDPLRLAKSIDHTLLKPEAKADQFKSLCAEAIQYNFMSVCVPPIWVDFCKSQIEDNNVLVCTVIGFPLGANDPRVKIREAEIAIANGADELDMVLNFSALINNRLNDIHRELSGLRKLCPDKTLKLILETCYLNEDQKIWACELAVENGWDFVKTSTGFGTSGASIEDVQLMKKVVAGKAQVKASGGIRSKKTAIAMLEAGATRLGTSAGVSIVSGEESDKGDY